MLTNEKIQLYFRSLRSKSPATTTTSTTSTSSSTTSTSTSTPAGGGYDPVYLIMGQSNAHGVNEGSTALPANLKIQQPQVFFGKNNNTNVVTDGSYAMVDGTASLPDVGCEHNLGYLLNQHKQREIYIYTWAIGGSKITAGSSSPDWHYTSPSTDLLGKAMSSVQNMMNKMIANGRNPKLHAVIWNQGENDATGGTTQSYYETALTGLINKVRTTFGDNNLNLQICRTKIWSSAPANITAIRAAQENVANNVANVDLIDCDDAAAVSSDPIHISTAGQQLIGQKIFNNVKNISY